ncbi:MAG TPA: M20/M25/M40 family metallo-hydrolase [Gemmatimonadales bacterium]|nr:M20/M25/M40 family metallo-hydrolase [Gemmatimonadales bacterium]
MSGTDGPHLRPGSSVGTTPERSDLAAGTTVNVGVISGGTRPNVVSDRAEAEIDLRVWTPEDAERMIARMREIAERVRVPGTRARFTGGVDFPPWPPGLPGTTRLLEIMTAVGRELGVPVRAIKTGGGSDGNHACHLAPTIDGLGPQGSRAHSGDEFIIVDSLLERTKLVALFLDRWAADFAV